MSTYAQQLAATLLICSVSLTIAGCKNNPFGERSTEVVNVAQVPAAVKATFDQEGFGMEIVEIELR